MVGLLYFQESALCLSTLLMLIPWILLLDRIEKFRETKVYILLLFGLLTRLVYAPFFAHTYDIQVVHQAVDILLQGQSPYGRGDIKYLPIFYYTEALVVLLAGKGIFYFKLPIIFSEIILGFLIYKMSIEYTHNERLAYYTSALFLLNPWMYFQTVIFGHFDSIPTMFMVLAIYLLIKERGRFSALSLGIGVMYKLFPIVLLPIIVLYLIRQKEQRWQRIIEYIAIVTIFCIFISLPYLILSYDAYTSVLLAVGGTRGLSIYRILFYFVSRTGISIKERSVIRVIQGVGWLITLLIFVKREIINVKFGLLEESTFFLLVFMLLNRYMSEQYIVWTIPLLILYFLGRPVGPQLGDMVLYYCYTCAVFFYRVVKWSVWFSLYDDYGFVFFSTFALSILFYHFIGWLIAIRFFRKNLPQEITQSFEGILMKLTKWARHDEKGTDRVGLRSYMTISSLQVDFSVLCAAIVIGMMTAMFIFQGRTDISFESFLLPVTLLSVLIAALFGSGMLISGIRTSNAIYTFINFWIIYIFEVGIYFHTDLLTILARALLIALASSIGYILVSFIAKFRRTETLNDIFR